MVQFVASCFLPLHSGGQCSTEMLQLPAARIDLSGLLNLRFVNAANSPHQNFAPGSLN